MSIKIFSVARPKKGKNGSELCLNIKTTEAILNTEKATRMKIDKKQSER